MSETTPARRAACRESGYALLLVIFLLALLVLGTVAVAPNVFTNARREKEAEMVWRGRQYTRGVRMYYMKLHRFPTSLDDLTQPKTGIRFMRQVYKDPMNTVDGSWRLIYVGPNGQLIGSLKNRTVNMGGMGGTNLAGALGGASPSGSSAFGGSSFGSSGTGSSGFGNSSFGNSSASTTAQNPGNAPASGTQAPGAGSATDANNPDNSDEMSTPHDLGPMDATSVIGGNIIGVGSKVNQKSVMWYDKAKNYRLFEFIWDPSKDMMVGAASQGIGTPVQNINSASPTGTGMSGTNPASQQNPGNNPDVPLQAPQNP